MSLLRTIDWLLGPTSSYPTRTRKQLLAHLAYIHKLTESCVVDELLTYYLNDQISLDKLELWVEPQHYTKRVRMKRQRDEQEKKKNEVTKTKTTSVLLEDEGHWARLN
ncbi:hypothetical protein AB4137_02950 [Vibrio breoganii]